MEYKIVEEKTKDSLIYRVRIKKRFWGIFPYWVDDYESYVKEGEEYVAFFVYADIPGAIKRLRKLTNNSEYKSVSVTYVY